MIDSSDKHVYGWWNLELQSPQLLLKGAVMYMYMSFSSCSMQQQAIKTDNTTDDLFKVTRKSNCERKIKFI